MSLPDLHDLCAQAVAVKGLEEVADVLRKLAAPVLPETGTLTVLANAGVHSIPECYLRGQVYTASQGDWDDSSEHALVAELEAILERLVRALRSQQWQRVYLIPTGHPVLSLQIKAMIYRLLRLNSIDLYHKAGRYLEVGIDQRAVALKASSGVQPDSQVFDG